MDTAVRIPNLNLFLPVQLHRYHLAYSCTSTAVLVHTIPGLPNSFVLFMHDTCDSRLAPTDCNNSKRIRSKLSPSTKSLSVDLHRTTGTVIVQL